MRNSTALTVMTMLTFGRNYLVIMQSVVGYEVQMFLLCEYVKSSEMCSALVLVNNSVCWPCITSAAVFRDSLVYV